MKDLCLVLSNKTTKYKQIQQKGRKASYITLETSIRCW